MTTIQFKRMPMNPDLPLPAYATDGAAGFDLRACVMAGKPTMLYHGMRMLVPTGFMVAIPQGYELQLRPRSGIAFAHGITLANAPATVDSDYRGEVMVILVNHGEFSFRINRGDRIAQAVLAPVTRATMVEVDDLDATARGDGGFGSTGTA